MVKLAITDKIQNNYGLDTTKLCDPENVRHDNGVN